MNSIIITTFTKVFIAVLVIILLIALGLNLTTLWRVHQIDRGQAVMGGYSVAVIGSGSMAPSLRKGDLLLVRGGSSLYPGDVITYLSPGGSLITHRVVEETAHGYITQGDANNISDEAVDGRRVLGRVVGVVPAVGGMMDSLASPEGFAIMGSLYVLFRLVRHRRREAKKYEAPHPRYLDAP